MKSRRSMWREGFSRASVVTRQAVVGRLLLAMTVHAETHVVIDDPLSDGLVVQIAVTVDALDLRANVRRVVEAYVRFVRETVHTLPRDLDALLRVGGDFL